MVRIDNVVYGPQLHMPIPNKSLGKLLYEYLSKHGDQLGFIDDVTKQQLTYKEFQTIACRLAQSIRSCGYKQEDVLGVCAENNIFFFCPVIAATYLGIPIVPINHYYGTDVMQHALNITKSKMIFCSENTAGIFLELKKSNLFIERIVMMGVKEALPGTITIEEFIAAFSNSADHESFEPVDVDVANQTAFILFSSGTTGYPKGVMITHKNVLMRVVHTFDPRMHRDTFETSACLGYLPFCHLSGLFPVLSVMLFGKPVIVVPRFEESRVFNCIERYKITSINAVPTVLVKLVNSTIIHEYDISTLKELIVGAAPISESLEKELKSKLGVRWIRQVYGMTETTFVILSVPAGVQKPGSSGAVCPGMAVLIRDLKSSKNLGPNQIGEICTKGGLVMKGFYENPQATQEMFTEDGWLKTGDLGYYDEEEYFYVSDRLKELIKYKSFLVPPSEIEGLLQKHPKIKDVVVVGLPDERDGELPLAFVVKQPEVELDENEVINFVAKHLSKHKHLHGGARFIDDIPKNLSGKILRRDLKRMIQKPILKL